MSRKIARITQEKKLLLVDEIVEDNRYSLNEHGKLYTKNILEGNKFSIDEEFIEVGEFIEGYPFAKPVIDDSLVLWLDGSTGNNYEKTNIWKDISGNGNDGVLKNFNFAEDNGWVGGGLRFDGGDDYVDLGLIDLREEITLDMIIELNLTSKSYNRIFTSTNDSISLFTVGNNKSISVKFTTGQGSYPRPTASIEFGRVMQVTFNYSTSTGLLKLYIDSQLKSEVQRDGTLIANSNPYTIGYVGTRGSFCGKCLSLKLYNRALTDEEILQNYQAGQCSPLLAMRGDVIG